MPKATFRQALPFLGAMALSVPKTVTSLLCLGRGVRRNEDVLLTLAFFSDTHVKAGFNLFLPAGLRDVSAPKHGVDAVVFTGDCTDTGSAANWQAFTDSVQKHCNVPRRLVLLGNHDTWTTYATPHDYKEALQTYLSNANKLMGTNLSTPWFTCKIKGYSFIVLASEQATTAASISDAQLTWADAALARAAEESEGRPIFVLQHHPMNFTHAVENNRFGAGMEGTGSEKLRAILDKYENVFFFSGHQHFGFNSGKRQFPVKGFKTVERVGMHITSVNLPAYGKGSFLFGGDPLVGDGLIVNVYDDRVELMGRCFMLHGWVRYKQTVALSKTKKTRKPL